MDKREGPIVGADWRAARWLGYIAAPTAPELSMVLTKTGDTDGVTSTVGVVLRVGHR